MPVPTVLSMRRLMIVAIALALALVATPALATPPQVMLIDEQFTDVDPNFCGAGVAVQIDTHIRQRAWLRHRGGVPNFQDTLRLTQTFTNVETGLSITNHFTTMSRDHVVDIDEDGLATVTVLATGADRWVGPDGKLVYNNPGQVRYQFVVDTHGTIDDPFDDILVADLGIVFGSTGRNDLEELGFCGAVLSVIG